MDVSTKVKFCGLTPNEREAAFLGYPLRRDVVHVTAEVGTSQSKLAPTPGEHRLKRLRRQALPSQVSRHHVRDVRLLAAARSKLDRTYGLAV